MVYGNSNSKKKQMNNQLDPQKNPDLFKLITPGFNNTPDNTGVSQPNTSTMPKNKIIEAAEYLNNKERQKKYGIEPQTNLSVYGAGNVPNNQSGYQSKYSAELDNIINKILNKEEFSYNPAADPTYKAYNDIYTRQAGQGMRDASGNAAALSGGYGNSYAAAVGQQTYDNYMSELNNVIPELYQAAYDKYQNDINNDYNSLNALQAMDESGYSRFANDRAYNYGVSQDQLAQQNWQNQFNYQKEYDTQQQQNWQDQFSYGKQQDQQAQQNWQTEFNYGKSRDNTADNQWQQTFNYGKQQDVQQQQNWQDQFDYGKQQDQQAQQNWQTEFDYGKQQDTLDRDQYLQQIEDEQGEAAAEKSQKNIDKYSDIVDKMLSTMTDDSGLKVNKYSPADVMDYLLSIPGLTDDEIAQIVNDNYELSQYYK